MPIDNLLQDLISMYRNHSIDLYQKGIQKPIDRHREIEKTFPIYVERLGYSLEKNDYYLLVRLRKEFAKVNDLTKLQRCVFGCIILDDDYMYDPFKLLKSSEIRDLLTYGDTSSLENFIHNNS